ncbi:MAG TPA: EamA family transporter [Anaerolineales bacterium]|nr:EamA family transporter [Anaerolineales bacterium]
MEKANLAHEGINTKGYLVSTAAALVLSTTAILIRILTNTYQLPPLVLAFWRDLFTCLFLALILGTWKPGLLRLPPNQTLFILSFGLALALFNAFWTTAVAQNGAALATVLAYTSAAFTAILGRWLLKERLYAGKWVAIALSFSGVVLISGVLSEPFVTLNLGGTLVGIFSGLMYAGYSLLGRTASQRQINPWTTLLYTFGFATLFLMVFNLGLGHYIPGAAQDLPEFLWKNGTWQGWAILLILAAGPTLAGYGLYNVSLGMLPSSVANLILTTEPVFTSLIAFIALGERLTQPQLGGSLLIILGILFLRLIPISTQKINKPGT